MRLSRQIERAARRVIARCRLTAEDLLIHYSEGTLIYSSDILYSSPDACYYLLRECRRSGRLLTDALIVDKIVEVLMVEGGYAHLLQDDEEAIDELAADIAAARARV